MLLHAGIMKLKEREYLGTIQSIRVNAEYAAVRFDGKINLHMVSTVEQLYAVISL